MLAKNILNKIPNFNDLPSNIQQLMEDSFTLGMLELETILSEEALLDLTMKINEFKKI